MDKFVATATASSAKLGTRATLYKHRFSPHTHLHVANARDKNNVFALAFRTAPKDSTGLPHILEHTALCGSKQFPVRDPFFRMLSRSLANFMNAMTGADYTYFPFATTNAADYANLQSVYMDSVFRPLLRKADFLQEGWRLEPKAGIPASLDELSKSDLEFKGVVYNEMKGQLSIPAYFHYTKWYEHVCPEMHCSGGEPTSIVDLKYADLVAFHRNQYSSANSFTYSYGDAGIGPILARLEPYLASSYNKSEPSEPLDSSAEEVNWVSRITENKKHVAYGPVDASFDVSRQLKSSLTWFVPASSCYDVFKWRVLFLLLSEGHSSPLYQALIDSGLGYDFGANSGIEEVNGGVLLTVGLQGMDESALAAFKQAVNKVLTTVSASGFDSRRVAAFMHQFELSNSGIDTNYGLNLLGSVVQRAVRREEYIPLLTSDKLLDELKLELETDAGLMQTMIKQSLLDARYVEFELRPRESFEADVKALEEQKLASKLDSLTKDDLQLVYDDLVELKTSSQAAEPDCLPKISPSQLDKSISTYEVQKGSVNSIQTVSRRTVTAGMTYISLLRDISALKPELLPYIPLYTACTPGLGTLKHSPGELEDLIYLYTGGIGVSPRLTQWNSLELAYSSSCLAKNVDKMLDLLAEVVNEPSFQNESKLKTIIDSLASESANSLAMNGHSLAMGATAAQVSSRHRKLEPMSGLPFLRLVQRLSTLSAQDLVADLGLKLQNMAKVPLQYRTLGLTTDLTEKIDLSGLLSNAEPAGLPPAPSDSVYAAATAPLTPVSPFSVVQAPLQVAHVGFTTAVGPSSYLSPVNAALAVLARIMTFKYLHVEIREKGGAYGGGARYSPLEGLFQMYSYRDPTPKRTVEVFQNALEWAQTNEFTLQDVDEGKIAVFQSLDAPVAPRNEISRYINSQYSDADRQVFRTNLLNVTKNDLHEAAKLLKSGAVCVIGQDAIEGYTVTTI